MLFKLLVVGTSGAAVLIGMRYHKLKPKEENLDAENVWLQTDTWYHPRSQALSRGFAEAFGDLEMESLPSLRKKLHRTGGEGVDGSDREFFEGIRLQWQVCRGLPAHPVPRLLLPGQWQNGIQFRNLLLAHLERFPEARDMPVKRPLFVTGLPSSGFSLLHRLLSLDPATRSPLLLELLAPAAAPLSASQAAALASTELHRAASKNLAWQERLWPGWMAWARRFHDDASLEGPGEDSALFVQGGFDCLRTQLLLDPSFSRWLADSSSKRSHYRLLRRFLQTRQHVHPPASHWVCKASAHMLYPDRLLEEFPDASVVYVACPAARLLPFLLLQSTALQAVQGLSFSLPVDAIRDGVLSLAEASLSALHAFALAHPDAPFLTVSHADLLADPCAVVARIYRHFGYSMSPQYTALLTEWVLRHPQELAPIPPDPPSILPAFHVSDPLIDRYPQLRANWNSNPDLFSQPSS